MSERTEAMERGVDGAPGESGDGPAGTEYDLGRLLTFTDGVFAIAITLLVLDIPVPVGPPARLWPALLQLYPRLIAFGLSFLLVGIYWLTHHRLFRNIGRCTGTLLRLNLALLFGICLIPFSAAVMARDGETVAAIEVYGANLAGVGLLFFGMRVYADSQGLTRRTFGGRQRADGTIRAAAMVTMFLLAMAVAPFNTTLSYFGWAFSAPVAGFVQRVLVRLRN